MKVEVHPSCKQSTGLITCSVLFHNADESIAKGLATQGVTKVVRVGKNSSTFKLTFSSPTLPATITVCPGQVVAVRKAYPLPIRCFRCQHYGHSHAACKKKSVICGRCGQSASDDHDPKTCTGPEHCFHCKTGHSASSPSCPKYVAEKRILLLHYRDNVPLVDARRQVMSALAASQPLSTATVVVERAAQSAPAAPQPPSTTATPALKSDANPSGTSGSSKRRTKSPLTPEHAEMKRSKTSQPETPGAGGFRVQTGDKSELPLANRFTPLSDENPPLEPSTAQVMSESTPLPALSQRANRSHSTGVRPARSSGRRVEGSPLEHHPYNQSADRPSRNKASNKSSNIPVIGVALPKSPYHAK